MATTPTPGYTANPVVQNSTIPFTGPYEQQQNLAQLAYNNALNQYNNQYLQTLQGYGFMPDNASDPTNGAFHANMSNPYGQYQQMLGQNQQEADTAEHAARLRGFSGAGLGAQQEELAQKDAGGRSYQFFTDLASKLQQINQGKVQANFDLQNQTLQNQLAQIEAATQNQQFTPAVVKKVVQATKPSARKKKGGR